jgi:6-phosphogluconolactonase
VKATWRIESDAAAVADAACRLVSSAARAAIAKRGRFRLVLAGGSTPLSTYRRLAASDQQWKRWSLYYGDERCLPAEDPERNSQMVMATGITSRAGEHLPIPAELGTKAAVQAYRKTVRPALPFDMVLLGMGEDGHTASLFPGRDWPDKPVFAVKDSPKPPAERVTLGIAALQDCRAMLVMVTGTDKAAAVQQWRQGVQLPVAQVSDIPQATVLVERNCLEFAGRQSIPATEAIELYE